MFLQQRTARVDRPLTYAVGSDVRLFVGDVVRVPLGPRELYGYVVSPEREGVAPDGVRPIVQRIDGPRAFDETSLALARWIAAHYCCSLGEALGAAVFAAALPRVSDRFRVVAGPDPADFPRLPPRLLRLLGEDLAEGFSLDGLLRHPEARRAGDRRTLLAAVSTLQRAGVLRRERTFVAPRVGEAHERLLETTGVELKGPRATELIAHVRQAGVLRWSDAMLAGFSAAVVKRALREGALRASTQRVATARPEGAREARRFAATGEQRAAIAAIVARVRTRRFAELLVHGITGSGKTFVYICAIARVLEDGSRAIVLVPEIALTPQTARRFEAEFGERVAVLHSGLSDRERFESWQAAARGDVDVVVGARSAVFAPLPDVRLIVIDEAHERSYKQDGVPRYDALAAARTRMRFAGGTLVLGSATPPLEAHARAEAGAIGRVRLRTRATAQALPATTIVDLTEEFERGNRRIFSTRLVDAIGERLRRREKTVLFVNRRGSASFMLCRRCGAVPQCSRCSISLTVHRAEHLLRCHLCDAQAPLPSSCPACGDGPIREFGVGTQTVVRAVNELFAGARVVRMDGDTTTRVGDHARLLDEFVARGDVLVGTQMIAKGLDFPTVTLVGIVAADTGLHVPDFRAAERTFDLITQVAGRSGRARPGEAIVQTYSPAHPAIAFAARHDYDGFARQELEQRRELRYPPFADLVYLGIIGRSQAAVAAAAGRFAELVRSEGVAEVLGPAPAPVARVNDEWRYRIALKAADGRAMRHYLRELLQPLAARERGVRLAVNVDP